MRRFHLFEFNDLSWLQVLHEALLDCLNLVHRLSGPYRSMSPYLDDVMREAGKKDGGILDLCSGGGEHIRALVEDAKLAGLRLPKITLTDLYPRPQYYEKLQKEFGPNQINYVATSVSALSDNSELARGKMIMLCSSLHHFKPVQAREIIAQALRSSGGIIILEMTPRKFKTMSRVVVESIPMLAAPFFAHKFSLMKFVFTTLIPVIPFMFAFDGIVSCLRTYKEEELMAMIPADLRSRVRTRFERVCSSPGMESYFFSVYLV